MQSFNSFKDHIWNPWKSWRIVFCVILQSSQGLCSPSKDWRIRRIPSTLRRTTNEIFQPLQGSCDLWKSWRITNAIFQTKGFHDPSKCLFAILLILQAFQGLWMQSFEGSKYCMWSFNNSKDYIHNHWKDRRITYDPSTLPTFAFIILASVKELHYDLSTLTRIMNLILGRIERLHEICQPF